MAIKKGTMLKHAAKGFYVKVTGFSGGKVFAHSRSESLTFDRKKLEWMLGKGIFKMAMVR